MCMEKINKKQKIGLVVLIVLALIFLGYFYVKSSKTVESPSLNTENMTDANFSGTQQGEMVGGTTLEVEGISSVDKETLNKFNSTLEKGNKSFLVKNYDQAIAYYKQALDYKNSDAVYSRLFSAYNAQNNIDQARISLEKAISINPGYTDYWITKLIFLNEKTSMSFLDLKTIYEDGLKKVDPKTKINLVTSFAAIAENNTKNTEAIALWEYAIQLYPQNKLVYQAEIDRLK